MKPSKKGTTWGSPRRFGRANVALTIATLIAMVATIVPTAPRTEADTTPDGLLGTSRVEMLAL